MRINRDLVICDSRKSEIFQMLQSFIDINILQVSFVIFKSERQAYDADFSMYEIIDTLQR